MARFWAELVARHRALAWTGAGHLALAAALLPATLLDPRTILGLDPWIKPLKFAVSITIYVWTVAWLIGYLRDAAPRSSRLVGRGIAAVMIVEIVCIAGQSARGVPSHFNDLSGFNAAVFSLMGSMIAVNTMLVVGLLGLFLFCDVPVSRPHLWGIRLGLLSLLLGSAEGGFMILHGAHTFGAADGGPGLPFVNWSTRAGDLRVAHALGLHGLQVLVLAGWALGRGASGNPRSRSVWVFALTCAYLAVAAWTFAQALARRPLLPL